MRQSKVALLLRSQHTDCEQRGGHDQNLAHASTPEAVSPLSQAAVDEHDREQYWPKLSKAPFDPDSPR